MTYSIGVVIISFFAVLYKHFQIQAGKEKSEAQYITRITQTLRTDSTKYHICTPHIKVINCSGAVESSCKLWKVVRYPSVSLTLERFALFYTVCTFHLFSAVAR